MIDVNPLSQRLSFMDPSRYTVYKMLEYTSSVHGIDLVTDARDGIFLIKTDPFVDSLYNYAHVLGKRLPKTFFESVESFFNGSPFKVKIVENDSMKDTLLSNGFRLKKKSLGYIMVAKDVKELEMLPLPSGAELKKVTDRKMLDDYKKIFSEAFECSVGATNTKFGFLDKIILDNEDDHVNTFVIYEEGVPVSTGSYYAFGKFSVENIGTVNDARGKKYAYRIMQVLMGEASRLGYNEACLVASEAGSGTYKRVGFENIFHKE